MWFKNLRFFRLHLEWDLSSEQLFHALEQQQFQPVGSQDMASIGWIAPAENLPLALQIEQQILLCVQTEKKLLPASVINQFARQRAQEVEAEQGYRPGRKQMQTIKEDATAILLPRAFAVQRQNYVWIDPTNRWLVIDAAAQSNTDEILSLLGETFTPFPAQPVATVQSASSTLTQWLLQEHEPEPFLIEDEAELRSKQDSRAVVRYVRHALNRTLISEQIEQGMYCSRLGLSWQDRISFVLNENLELKRITPLDQLVDEQNKTEYNAEEELAASFLLMSSELNGLLQQLIEILGGEKT